MRTTLTLDDDVAARLRRLAERRRTSFKEVVNAVLRRGLSRQQPSRESPEEFRVLTFRSAFRPGVDLLRLNSLSDELEVRHAAGDRP
jgi:hypothetical protein